MADFSQVLMKKSSFKYKFLVRAASLLHNSKMKEKCNQKYEDQITLLAFERIKSGKYKVFDHTTRIAARDYFPEFVEKGKTDNERCLVIINCENENIVITKEFETILRNALTG